MKYFFMIFSLFSISSFAGDVITCGDALSVKGEANTILHKVAQERAQKAIESFIEKKLLNPYPFPLFGTQGKGTPEATARGVEVFWCETSSTPLHSAYYDLYSNNKSYFEKQ